jgi:hypothetical protein
VRAREQTGGPKTTTPLACKERERERGARTGSPRARAQALRWPHACETHLPAGGICTRVSSGAAARPAGLAERGVVFQRRGRERECSFSVPRLSSEEGATTEGLWIRRGLVLFRGRRGSRGEANKCGRFGEGERRRPLFDGVGVGVGGGESGWRACGSGRAGFSRLRRWRRNQTDFTRARATPTRQIRGSGDDEGQGGRRSAGRRRGRGGEGERARPIGRPQNTPRQPHPPPHAPPPPPAPLNQSITTINHHPNLDHILQSSSLSMMALV